MIVDHLGLVNLNLVTSKRGLQAIRVMDPAQLEIGDVIFYDFEGDGRIDLSYCDKYAYWCALCACAYK